MPKVTPSKNNKGPEARVFSFVFALFYSQASCLSIHPGFPIYKMGMILIPFLSLEHVARTAAHLSSYPERNLHQCPLLIYLLCGSWLLPACGQGSLPSLQKRGWRDIKRNHSCALMLHEQGPPPSCPSRAPALSSSSLAHSQITLGGPALTP